MASSSAGASASPGVLTKLLKRGTHAYREILHSSPGRSAAQGADNIPQGTTSLLDVVRDEDLEEERRSWVEWLENEGVADEDKRRELSSRDGRGWTVLHHAARHGRTEVLSCAADIDGVDMNVRTYGDQLSPLLVAAKYSVKNSIVWMMGHKETIETSAVSVDGQNALHLVVQNLQCEYSLEPLLRQLDRKLWHDEDSKGNTPLHVAAAHGNSVALQQGFFKREIWLGQEEQEEGGGSDGGSDAEGSDAEGSDVEKSDVEGSDTAGSEKVGDGEDEDNEEGGPRDSLWVSDRLKTMVLATNKQKQTPLHLAAENGYEKVVGLLIDKCRAVIKCQDCEGNMALHLACHRGHLEVAREILEWEPTTVGNKYTNHKGETPVHCAAYNTGDSGSLMEYLMEVCEKNATLDTQDILSLHEKEARHTPLMLACTKGKPEVVKVLLQYGADVTQREKEVEPLPGQEEEEEQETLNSLELAIENGRREVAKVMMDCPEWGRCLRTSNVIERVANTPFRRMIRKMPDIALLVMDKCTQEKNDRDDVSFEMSFDYEFVEDFYIEQPGITPTATPTSTVSNVLFSRGGQESREAMVAGEGEREEGVIELRDVKIVEEGKKEDEKEEAGVQEEALQSGEDVPDIASSSQPHDEDWKPREYVKQNHVLSIMVDHNRSELLRHPLVTSLLNHKWSQFGAWIYFSNLLFYLIYVFFLTAFGMVVPNPQSDTCESRDSGNSTSCGISSARRNFLYLAALVTILLALARLVVEVFQLVHWTQSKHPNCCGKRYKLYINWEYWLDWTNYLEITLYSFSIAFVVVFDDCFCPTDYQWQIGTVAVFFAWIDLLLFFYKLPKIGIYVGMMLQITRRFLNVVVIAVVLSLAFGFAFYMAFYEPSIPASPFANPALSFVKLMVMTSGGPDDSIFRYENEGSGTRDALPFPAVAFFIWVIFIVIMAILFVNFLVGLAVDDVKQIQQSATLRRLSLKVDLVLSMEQAFPVLRHHKRFAISNHRVFPNERLRWHKRLWRKVYSLVWDDDLTDSIQSSLNPDEDTDFKVDSLHSVVEQLVAKTHSQEKMLVDILQELRKQNKQLPT